MKKKNTLAYKFLLVFYFRRWLPVYRSSIYSQESLEELKEEEENRIARDFVDEAWYRSSQKGTITSLFIRHANALHDRPSKHVRISL